MERVGKRVNVGKILEVLFYMAIGFSILWFLADRVRSAKIAEEAEKAEALAVHQSIIATTQDASAGTGLIRVRQQKVVAPDGSCSVTVQRYLRWSDAELFKSAYILTLPCAQGGGG
jgi:hypothetical protein